MKAFSGVLFLLFFTVILCGNMYFWVDDSGTRHYTNVAPPPGGNAEELTEVTRTFENLTSGEETRQKFKVLKVFDGDSLQVTAMDLVFSIRLCGIDSPEIGDGEGQPFSREAKAYLENLINNREVTFKNYGVDSYHRQLAEVFVDGKNINIEMIKQGLAEVYKGVPPKALDLMLYLKEEKLAKKAAKGIWKLGKSYKSPRQWRRENPRK